MNPFALPEVDVRKEVLKQLTDRHRTLRSDGAASISESTAMVTSVPNG